MSDEVDALDVDEGEGIFVVATHQDYHPECTVLQEQEAK